MAHVKIDRDAIFEQQHARLMQEFIDALTRDPGMRVSAPAWAGARGMPAYMVIEDELASEGSEHLLQRILLIVAGAANSQERLLRMSAIALIAELARDYADTHIDQCVEDEVEALQ